MAFPNDGAYTLADPTYEGTARSAGAPQIPVPEYGNVFIPILWSTKLIEKFYDASVVPAMSNTNYEGEIKQQGDHVMIRQRPDIEIHPYEADGKLQIDRPSADLVELLIDKGNYWNVALDDVMDVQSDLNMMNMWSQDAAEQMRIVIDREVLDYAYVDVLAAAATAYTSGASGGRISQNINLGVTTAPIQLTYAGTGPTAPDAVVQDIMDFVLRMAQVLDENNAPETGRFLVVPAWACQMLKASDLRMANEMGDSTSVYRNGQIGTLDRMAVYKSNLLPDANADQSTLTGTEHVIYCGVDAALTFASQITKVETLRAESTFANLMRGLQVYGRQVIDPKLLVGAVVTQ